MRIIYLKASVKDSVDNDKGEEGDEPSHEGKKDHQDERVHLFLRLRSLGLVPNAPSSSQSSDLEDDHKVGSDDDQKCWEGKNPEKETFGIVGNT